MVLSGSAKAYLTAVDGAEQVVGFYLPGELLGLDGLEGRKQISSVIALEKTMLCELPYTYFEDLCFQLPRLGKRVLAQFARQLAAKHEMLLLLGQKDVEARLAALLLSLSTRLRNRGFSATEFNLSMSKYDTANFLGVAPETVSRLFARLVREGVLSVDGKLVCIKDLERLQMMNGCAPSVSSRLH